MQRRTVVVSGPLAFRMRRLEAARAGELGLEILTLPQLAARLAGGFQRPASADELQPAIRSALQIGRFAELDSVRGLPGMARAVARTLSSMWRADQRFQDGALESPRLADLAALDADVRARLPRGALAPPDLRDAALRRVVHARVLFGDIRLERLLDVDPVWRPLLVALAAEVPISWRAAGALDRSWFSGELLIEGEPLRAEAEAVVCADPRAEVVEALRWARGLLSRGNVAAADVAVAAADPGAWDEHMLVLATEAGLPLHFSHGRPALNTREGQACAALADVLAYGLSQDRVRRLLRQVPLTPVRRAVPEDWSRGLARGAGLFTPTHWAHALAATRPQRDSGASAEVALSPLLEMLARGPAAANEAGEHLLEDDSLHLWREALRLGPPESLGLTLAGLRRPDSEHPGTCISWGPAAHLAGAPRPYVRLLGLTSRGWPRGRAEDPLLPDHVLPRALIEPTSRTNLDCVVFEVICAAAGGALVLSRPRRSAEGAVQPPSRLSPKAAHSLGRTRIPEHAFSEADRLLARPTEAQTHAQLASAQLCWRNWRREGLTAHDGCYAPNHPVVERALRRVHSTRSLRRLLRDPLGFVWQYALHWTANGSVAQPLSLGPGPFGELVHELLRRAVDTLEPAPGLSRANESERLAAMDAVVAPVAESWPLMRAVPPELLWRHTLEEAADMALAGLAFDPPFQPDTRSWTELAFGDPQADGTVAGPWNPAAAVGLGAAGVRLQGRIDRVDIAAGGEAVRVTDYKTMAAPRNADRLVLGKGMELQRVAYAAALRQLLPDLRQVVSRLVYLGGKPVQQALKGDDLVAAEAELERHVQAALGLLRNGIAPPGPDAEGRTNALRLALPAEFDAYRRRKQAVFGSASTPLADLWRGA